MMSAVVQGKFGGGRPHACLLMSVLLVACPLHAGWIDAEPRLAPSQLYFHPLCAQTSCGVLRYMPMVFARK